jgi:hypothetical protein
MNDQEINIAIAQACGWEVAYDTLYNITPDRNGDPEIEPVAPLPDYVNNLNECSQFESLLDVDQLEKYYRYLDSVISGKTCFKISEANHLEVLKASPSQRCEAFLKTMGKWIEDSK